MSYFIEVKTVDFLYIDKLIIKKSLNNHSILELEGEIKENNIEKYQKIIGQQIDILLNNDEDKRYIYCGIIEDIEINITNHNYFLKIKAYSYSCQSDKIRKFEIHQNINKTYKDIIEHINKNYKFKFSLKNKQNEKTEKIILQYNETDFEFIKRLGSYLNENILINGTDENERIDLGLINQDSTKLENINYKININKQSIEYEFETNEIYNLGIALNIAGKDLIVKEIIHFWENAVLKSKYILTEKKYLNTEKKYNNIKGMSLKAKVTNNKFDEKNIGNVQIKFNDEDFDIIDKDNEKYWFDLSTNYSANDIGLFIMPEINEIVNVYFPDNIESNCFINTIRRDENKINKSLNNPDDKIFRNNNQKELKLNKEQIKISSLDEKIFILLTETEIILKNNNSSVTITGNNIEIKQNNSIINIDSNISVNTNDVSINNKNTDISSNGKVNIDSNNIDISGNSNININSEKINIKGGTTNINNGKIVVN